MKITHYTVQYSSIDYALQLRQFDVLGNYSLDYFGLSTDLVC